MVSKKDIVTVSAGVAAAVAASLGAQFALADAGPVNAHPTAPVATAPGSFANIIARVAPAVVSVDVEAKPPGRYLGTSNEDQEGPGAPDENDPFEMFRRLFPNIPQTPRGPMRATGSGFFISDDGYIVTNNHVVEGATKVTVRTNDDRTLPARIIGRDPATDLAVIKVEGHGFPFVSFEDRAKPRVGDWVVAVGNPFNLGGTATAGIVSALGREHISGSNYVDYMQIDAPINRGNSGGPTFDVYGRVVGVNTAIYTPSGGSVGIGFDIPADVAATVSHELIAHGKIVRGYIGALVQEVTPEIAASLGLPAHRGALVADVTPGGPSAAAGLKSGDLVLTLNGHPVASSTELTREIALVRPGDVIHLGVRRNGRELTVDVRAGVRPSEQALAADDNGPGGVERGALGLGVTPNPGGGLKIESIDPQSDAATKGLAPGDVIRRVGERPANSAADVSAAIAAAKAAGRDEVLLLVTHHGQTLFVPVKFR